MRPHVYFIKTVGRRCTTSLRSFIADARSASLHYFFCPGGKCAVWTWRVGALRYAPTAHPLTFSLIAREGDKGKILKWRTHHAAPPRLPAAFALPAHENEVKFPLKNRANGLTAVAVVPVHEVRDEVHVPRTFRAVPVERTRPIVVQVAREEQFNVVAIARRREENGVAVDVARYDLSFYACAVIVVCPCPRAVVTQFRPFGIGGHTPCTTPVGTSGIVLGVEHGFVIHGTITAICVVFGKSSNTSIAPFVGTLRVFTFWFGFSPSIVIAVLLWLGGTYVAGCPFGTARQTKVDSLMTVFKVIVEIKFSHLVCCSNVYNIYIIITDSIFNSKYIKNVNR